MTHPKLHHVKEHAQGFPKMWYFSIFKGFKPELLTLKVGSNLKKKILEVATSQKKDTLSHAMFISMPSLSRIMPCLEAGNRSRRHANKEDLRKTMVSSTSTAQAMVAEAAIWSDTRYSDIAQWFGKERLEHLQQLLDELVQTLDQHQ